MGCSYQSQCVLAQGEAIIILGLRERSGRSSVRCTVIVYKISKTVLFI